MLTKLGPAFLAMAPRTLVEKRHGAKTHIECPVHSHLPHV